MGSDKAPGPDGFNAGFFKQNWSIVGVQITKAVSEFFQTGKLLKEMNHTFLTLIPKTATPTSMSDYRPISCCNTIFKVISKVISNRMKKVLPDLLSPNQHAFLKGKHIGECSLLAHELIRDFNNKMGARACLKLDLQKAYDSVNREFIYYILHCMGFNRTWIGWIRTCIASPTFSVMINGSPQGFFGSSRGLRQGDPLSPFLFVTVMEFLSIHIDLMMASGQLQPIKRGLDNLYSHLLFADDLLIFCRANNSSLSALNNLFSILELNTGLCINKQKSKIFFSKGTRQRANLSAMCGITTSNFPTRYLGIPLTVHYLKAKHYSCLIDRMRRRIDGWSSKTLSLGGRIELINSVIYGMLYYWALSFRTPVKIISEVNSLCSQFLWQSNFHGWSWEQICKPKKEGGLGVRKVKDISLATGLKLLWCCITQEGMLGKWLQHRYLRNFTLNQAPQDIMTSGTWKFILSSRNEANTLITYDNRTEKWKWLPHPSGQFTFNSAWNSVRKHNTILPFYATIWHSFQCPKMSICILRALLKKLPTKNRLHSFGIVQDTLCVLCGSAPETEEHLFFECKFSNRIWKLCCLRLLLYHPIQTLSQELETIQSRFKHKTRTSCLAKLAISAAVWHIWQERNIRIFNNQRQSPAQVLTSISRDCSHLIQQCHWKVNPEPACVLILQHWDIPAS